MRSILVFADRGDSMSARLETALAIARAHDGHVSLVVDTPVSRYIAMDPMGGSYVASEALRDAVAADDEFAAGLEKRLAHEDVAFDIVRCEDDPVDALAEAGRLADVVVVSQGHPFAGQIALTGRTPVLVVPCKKMLKVPLGAACIGWDGGDEAALALRSAVPLLAGCPSVHVLTVAEKPGGFPPTDALRYLSRHGVRAELHELTRNGTTGETLAGAVARLRAELLVMGAFGHSRMREYLFGGVTRYFFEMEHPPALLLAH